MSESTKKDGRLFWVGVILAPIIFLLGNFILILSAPVVQIFVLLKLTYSFNTIVFPTVLTIISFYGIIVRKKNRSKNRILLISATYLFAAVCIFGLRIYATHIEPYRLILREVTIKTPKVHRPVRILHLSDIQSAAVKSHEKRVFKKIRSLDPDIVLYTGDFVQPIPPATPLSELKEIADLFRSLDAPLGKFGVYGNVDWRIRKLPHGEIEGVKILESEHVLVMFGKIRINIFGLSERQSVGQTDTLRKITAWLSTTTPRDFTILMGHRPDYILSVQDVPIDLCLAGHTHGGQIRLPLIGPIITFSQIPRSWARGYREIGKTRLNVSAGIGSEHSAGLPSIRINCPPEMTLIELCP